MGKRQTRGARKADAELAKSLASNVLATGDIMSLLLPLLDFKTFVRVRLTSKAVCAATQEVCEDLIKVLERAAVLYISPKFAAGLDLIQEHEPHIIWLLQTPALAVVAPKRYATLIASSYHLLQAHLSRLQKLAVSLSLRRASAESATPAASRYMLMHLGVRLGMFTESASTLTALHASAEEAVVGMQEAHRTEMEQPPETAAAHYTLAGFYTYHHRRQELKTALEQAAKHLEKALRIQTRQLGQTHITTLCSQVRHPLYVAWPMRDCLL